MVHEEHLRLNGNEKVNGKKYLRILVMPVLATGHVNACAGLGKSLLKRGHRVAFFLDQSYRNQMKKLGFEEFIYETSFSTQNKNAQDTWAHYLLEHKVLGETDTLVQLKKFIEMFIDSELGKQAIRDADRGLRNVIDKFQPDLFMIDNSVLWPCVHRSGIPWVNVISAVPLYGLSHQKDLPPAWSGLSINSDKSKWSPYFELLEKFQVNKDFNDLFEEMGYERYPNDKPNPKTQSLTVYAFPEEYNYEQIRKLDKWFNVEVFNKNDDEETVALNKLVPEDFFNDSLNGKWSGKWIYVSMGSMGGADLDLMKRILEPLAKTHHKYIVSKGPRYQEYELPGKNMWGDRFLPQLKILPHMDLILTHGGNNTITETYYHGKPMIIFPLFADQHDNGQRMNELVLAIRMKPYEFTETDLLESIERILNDQELKIKLEKAAERIRKSNNHEKFCDLVEEIVEKHKTKKLNDSQSLRILVLPILATGHVNACAGLGKSLLKRGHRVAFFLDQSYRNQLSKLGFEEFIYESTFSAQHENAQDTWAHHLLEHKVLGERDTYAQLKKFIKMFFDSELGKQAIREADRNLCKVIDEFHPDIFLIDNSVLWPCVHRSGIPWVNVISTAPLYGLTDCRDLPPAWSGLSINSDKSTWIPYFEILETFNKNKDFNDLFEEMGYDRYPDDRPIPKTQSLTVYAFPEEYNYDPIRKLDKWINIEVYNKNEQKETICLKKLVPEEFFNDNLNGKWSGKWIYVSMGSMGAADLKLMKRILEPLAKTSHKYIVSKGPRYQEYELPGKNMWGDRYLPQLEILPQMDLVLTHGGNNTITETFAQGKPMIIFPLWCDQHDNGQRLSELRLAIKLKPYEFVESELLESVERLLNDEELKMKLEKAAERIRNSNSHEKVCNLIEQIVKNHPNKN